MCDFEKCRYEQPALTFKERLKRLEKIYRVSIRFRELELLQQYGDLSSEYDQRELKQARIWLEERI